MSDNIPNLDAMTPDDLWCFWRLHQRGRNMKRLFPAGGKGTRKATGALADYASNKATAMGCRSRGEIRVALSYEAICDWLYERLPEQARW